MAGGGLVSVYGGTGVSGLMCLDPGWEVGAREFALRARRQGYTSVMARVQDGRRTELSATEYARRAQIIACARDVIAEVGYHQTTLGKIAERAGITKGLIAYHFGSKDGLIEAVLREMIQQGADYAKERLRGCKTWRERVRTYMEATVDYLVDHPTAVRACLAIVRDCRPLPSLADTEMARAEGGLVEFLRNGQDAGEFGDFSPEAVAMIVRNNLDHLPWRMNENPDFDVRAHGRVLVELVERWILRPASKAG
jgi:TetR/AcrR family fatty acid metabolism transcriptional regulator